MNKPIQISVFNLVGSSFCVDPDDGQAVFEALHQAITQKQAIQLSFQNVELLTSAFLNTAVGQLYNGDFADEDIRNYIDVVEIDPVDVALLRRVVNTAKLYYRNPMWLESSIERIMESAE